MDLCPKCRSWRIGTKEIGKDTSYFCHECGCEWPNEEAVPLAALQLDRDAISETSEPRKDKPLPSSAPPQL